MFENFGKKNGILLGLIILVILNIAAFYIVKEGIAISDALEHAENETIISSLQKKQIFTDVFPSIVITIDIACILFILYLMVKIFIKTLKKSLLKK